MTEPTPSHTRPEHSEWMTGRLRTVVRLADVLSEDLKGGTQYEQSVAGLLGYVAKAIVNGDAERTAFAIFVEIGPGPRADRVALTREAEMVAKDAADLEGEG